MGGPLPSRDPHGSKELTLCLLYLRTCNWALSTLRTSLARPRILRVATCCRPTFRRIRRRAATTVPPCGSRVACGSPVRAPRRQSRLERIENWTDGGIDGWVDGWVGSYVHVRN